MTDAPPIDWADLDAAPTPKADSNGHGTHHDHAAEIAILAGCAWDPTAIDTAATEGITGTAFHRPEHEIIWNSLRTLRAAGAPTDHAALADELRRRATKPALRALVDLPGIYTTEAVAAAVPHHARTVVRHARARHGATLALRLKQAYDQADPDFERIDGLLREHLEDQALQGRERGDSRLVDAGTFLFDAPDTIDAVWGSGEEVLWARGESLIIGGPTGIGKTTLVQQLVLAGIGVRTATLLGHPVQPLGRVLYLAMDRPAQARRSLRRMVRPEHRELLTKNLVVWKGPPPADVALNPRCLLELAQSAKADTVVIDSLKDTAVGVAKDEVGAAVNTAMQHLLAHDIEVLALHHIRKPEQGKKTEPTDTAEFYGSVWITAGAGSILSLWGSAGDLIVSARHLKQPAAEVGPWRLRHDHVNGTTEIDHGIDVLTVVRQQREKGLTANALAYSLFPREDDKRPTRNEVEKARRRLDSLTESGLLVRTDATGAGRGREATYFLAAHDDGELR